jgi:hypothetical protein
MDQHSATRYRVCVGFRFFGLVLISHIQENYDSRSSTLLYLAILRNALTPRYFPLALREVACHNTAGCLPPYGALLILFGLIWRRALYRHSGIKPPYAVNSHIHVGIPINSNTPPSPHSLSLALSGLVVTLNLGFT